MPIGSLILLLVKHSKVFIALLVRPLPKGPLKVTKSPTKISYPSVNNGEIVYMRDLLPYFNI